jgi:hypothetical protein
MVLYIFGAGVARINVERAVSRNSDYIVFSDKLIDLLGVVLLAVAV